MEINETNSAAEEMQALKLDYALLKAVVDDGRDFCYPADVAALIKQNFELDSNDRLIHSGGKTVEGVIDAFLAARPNHLKGWEGTADDLERAELSRIFGKHAIPREAYALGRKDIVAYRQKRERARELGLI